MQDTGNTFKIRVNLVQVHVIVRDNAGKPVAGLSKEDFQLYDNGKVQAISTFGVENDQSRKERAEAAAKTQEGEDGSNAGNSAIVPDRFIALTFDDVHLGTQDAMSVRLAAERFLDAMAPGDRVGIFTTSGQLKQDFTGDKELLKQTLMKLMPRGGMSSHLTTECPNISYYMADQLEKEGLPSTPQDPAPQDFRVYLQETARACRESIPSTPL